MPRKPTPAQLSWKQKRREASLTKWRALDWSKSNVELAEEMGYRNSSPISRARRLIGAPQSPRYHQYRLWIADHRKQFYLSKWRSWDWSKQDIELSRETGLSRERIRQIEVKALRKLRHPTRSKKLRDYLET